MSALERLEAIREVVRQWEAKEITVNHAMVLIAFMMG